MFASLLQSLNVKRNLLGEGHTSVFTTLLNLGHARYKSSDLGGALRMYKDSLRCQMNRLSGAKGNDIGSSDFSFQIHGIVTKVKQPAKDLSELNELSFALGNIAATLRNIALVMQDQGDVKGAIQQYKKILIVRKAQPVPDPQSIVMAADTIGMLEFKQGNHDGALAAFSEALEMKENIQKGDTIDIARSLNNLANVLFASGSLEEAMALYRRALGIKKDILGEDDDEIINLQNNIAHLLFTLERDKDCLRAYKEVLRLRKAKVGPNHLSVSTTLLNIGDLHLKMENLVLARSTFEDSVRIRKIYEGRGNDAEDSRALESLASSYGKLGDWKLATNAYQESLEKKKAVFGMDHKEIIKTLDLLAMSLTEQGRYIDAIQPVNEALELRRKHLGNEHPDVATQQNALAYLYKRVGYESKNSISANVNDDGKYEL